MSNNEYSNITIVSVMFMSFGTMGSVFTFALLIAENKNIYGIMLLLFFACMIILGCYLYFKTRWDFHSALIEEINNDLIPKIKHWKYDVKNVRWQKYIKIEIDKVNKTHNVYRVIYITLFVACVVLFFHNQGLSLFFLFFISIYAFNYFCVGLNYREGRLKKKALKHQNPEVIITSKGVLISKTYYISLNERGIYLRGCNIIDYKGLDNVLEFERVTPQQSNFDGIGGGDNDVVIFHFYIPIPIEEKVTNRGVWLSDLFFDFRSFKRTSSK